MSVRAGWVCFTVTAVLVAVLFALVCTHTFLVPVSPWKVPF